MVRTLGGGYMVARDLTGALTEGYDASAGLLGTAFKSGSTAWKDIQSSWQKGRLNKDWLAHLSQFLGMFYGGPGPAAVHEAEFGVGAMTGAEKPRGPDDVVRGILTGYARPKEERPR